MRDVMWSAFTDNFPDMWPLFRSGLIATLELSVGAIVIGLAVGTLICALQESNRKPIRFCAASYIEVMRGTPALIQLFLIYFGLASVGLTMSTFQAAVLGLGLNMSAYVAEALRGGFASVDKGQREAAEALGMTPLMVLRYIVFPQAFRVVLPPLGNLSISLVKNTSIAALISAPDLVLQARNLTSEYFLPLPIFLFVGAMYFCVCFPLSLMVRSLERRWTV
jgi:polar amino acid transport system permease protein